METRAFGHKHCWERGLVQQVRRAGPSLDGQVDRQMGDVATEDAGLRARKAGRQVTSLIVRK